MKTIGPQSSDMQACHRRSIPICSCQLREVIGVGTSRGFTLIELLLALTLLTILASVMLIESRSSLATRLDAASRVFADDLQVARAAAIRTNASWAVVFGRDGQSYSFEYRGAGTPPPLTHPVSGQPLHQHQVSMADLQRSSSGALSLSLSTPRLAESQTETDEVVFGPLGGLGPTLSEDVEVQLSTTGTDAQSMPLQVGWIDGQIWVNPSSPDDEIAVPDASSGSGRGSFWRDFFRRWLF